MATTVVDEADSAKREQGGTAGTTGASRGFSVLLIICGALGLLASAVITHDKMEILANPDYQSACSINPVLSCNNIMESWQASVFGFPNPFIGWVAYPIIIGAGAGLLAGGRHRRWYWLTMQAGTVFGVLFVTWLQYSSLYDIGALCLWCCLAWVVTILLFWYTLVHNIETGVIRTGEGLRRNVLEFHWAVPVLWVGIIAMLILTRWGSALWS
ncbi:vitamin K epoxide reductase family protein [Streptomyces sp. GC420]|uniref:vitamin K epoxide reductase family protein n=1 Tax=Streptomyces sp. GC420 TaxID=2697568 RepID=UPI0014150235|nr:vitamin K epoxide reductase family protein [Streptomyces sp. GC420]NBM16523.1 Vitamin K epoxide reductase [Streptomyces sp. GC420]